MNRGHRADNFVCYPLVLVLALAFAPGRAGAQEAETYYVYARGNDRNDGLSEVRAFRSLARAVAQAARSDTIKTITVIGTLNGASERGNDLYPVFLLLNESGNTEEPILITGLPGTTGIRRAVLSAAGTDRDCVAAYGPFRFEHIEISGSRQTGLCVGMEAAVTLGPGSLVRNNQKSGVIVSANFALAGALSTDIPGPGALTLDGGIIENNQGIGAGGGILVTGAFTMKRGSVRNNRALPYGDVGGMGGGIYISGESPVSLEGGDISGNAAGFGGGIYIDRSPIQIAPESRATEGYGGGRYISKGSVTMSGGSVSGNRAEGYGGGIAVDKAASFTQTGGTVSGNTAPNEADMYRVE